MAEWTNLFDLGECTVEVWRNNEATALSRVMGKGDSAEFSNEGRDYTIAVSVDGAVTLDGADDDYSYYYDIRVIPSYAHNYPARLIGVSFGPSASSAAGIINGSYDAEGVDYLEFVSVSPPSPDPLDMSNLTGPSDMVGLNFVSEGG